MSAETETTRRDLMVKQAQMARVLELYLVEQISTTAIAERLGISEERVCALIEESGRGR